jgi:DNA-binding NtrC family response regulator
MIGRLNILVVEDQQSERDALARLLRMNQHLVLTARNPLEALSHLHEPIGLVISDLRMGQSSGVDLLREWRKQSPDTPFVILTAYGDVRSAVSAMKLGAQDYLTKPVDPDQLLALTARALEHSGPVATDGASDATLQDLKRVAVMQTLERCNGKRSRAARLLGISVRTLQRKLKAWQK